MGPVTVTPVRSVLLARAVTLVTEPVGYSLTHPAKSTEVLTPKFTTVMVVKYEYPLVKVSRKLRWLICKPYDRQHTAVVVLLS